MTTKKIAFKVNDGNIKWNHAHESAHICECVRGYGKVYTKREKERKMCERYAKKIIAYEIEQIL